MLNSIRIRLSSGALVFFARVKTILPTQIRFHYVRIQIQPNEKIYSRPGFNDKANERAIVIHGADYVNESITHSKGFLGRSFGCPAIPKSISTKLINKIKKGNLLFIYYPDRKYLNGSEIING